MTLEGKQNNTGGIRVATYYCVRQTEICLGGYEKENWIQLLTSKIKPWINHIKIEKAAIHLSCTAAFFV